MFYSPNKVVSLSTIHECKVGGVMTKHSTGIDNGIIEQVVN